MVACAQTGKHHSTKLEALSTEDGLPLKRNDGTFVLFIHNGKDYPANIIDVHDKGMNLLHFVYARM